MLSKLHALSAFNVKAGLQEGKRRARAA